MTHQISKTWAFWFQTRRFLKVLLIFTYLLPWQSEICLDSKFLNNFQLVPPKDHSGEVWSKLAQWFRRRCQLLTDDGRQTTDTGQLAYQNSLLSTMCSGELKILSSWFSLAQHTSALLGCIAGEKSMMIFYEKERKVDKYREQELSEDNAARRKGLIGKENNL